MCKLSFFFHNTCYLFLNSCPEIHSFPPPHLSCNRRHFFNEMLTDLGCQLQVAPWVCAFSTAAFVLRLQFSSLPFTWHSMLKPLPELQWFLSLISQHLLVPLISLDLLMAKSCSQCVFFKDTIGTFAALSTHFEYSWVYNVHFCFYFFTIGPFTLTVSWSNVYVSGRYCTMLSSCKKSCHFC